jgi:phosphatidylinositol glycan class O
MPCSVFAVSFATALFTFFTRRSKDFDRIALLFSAFCASFLLLVGPRSAWVILLTVAILALFAEQNSSVLALSTLIWMLGMRLFNATGHDTVFSSLQMSSAFVGFEKFHFIRSGLMLFLNTFGCWLVVLLGLAVIIFSGKVTSGAGQMLPMLTFFRSLLAISLLCSLRALLSMISAAIQRRHLMVWEIFAPKFVFECCAMLFVDVCLIIISSVIVI